ncbi:MFS transporter [Sporosarcina sp. 179-K 3D1 HS]|uniref:MFS transporter n=1 Tax=Sporosarcina sp. 179-K 3D1 HS TaxID=3232169 RepID=UPI0039A3428F
MEVQATQKVKTTKQQWIQYMALVFSAFIAVEAMAFQSPAIPVISNHFQVPSHLAALIVLSFYIMSATLYPISGRLADKYGRKKVLLVGMAIFAVSEFAAAVSPTFSFLIVARMFQGVGVACIFPIVIAFIGVIFHEESRGVASGIFNSVQAIGAMLGAGLAGFLIKIYGWPIIYWVSGGLATIGFFTILFFVKESKGVVSGKLDYIGTMLLFIIAGTVLSVSTLVGQFGLTSPYTLGTLGVAILALAIMWIHGNRSAHPIIEISILKQKVFALIVLIYLIYTAAMQLLLYSMSFFLALRPGGDVAESGMFFMFNAGAAAIGGLIIGKLSDKVNNKKLLLVTYLLPLTAVLLLSRIDAYTQTPYILTLAGFFGFGAATAILIKYALQQIPPIKYGSGSGLLAVIRDFGAPLGSTTGIVLFSQFNTKAKTSSLVQQATDAGVSPGLMGDVQQAAATNGATISDALNAELVSLGIKFEDLLATALGEGATSAIQNLSYTVAGFFIVILILVFLIPQKQKEKVPLAVAPFEEKLEEKLEPSN